MVCALGKSKNAEKSYWCSLRTRSMQSHTQYLYRIPAPIRRGSYRAFAWCKKIIDSSNGHYFWYLMLGRVGRF